MIFDSLMVDLETMGVNPNAVIVQIGAVPFNSETGELAGPFFLADVNPESCIKLGGEVDQATVEWWTARGGWVPSQGQISMPLALDAFARFVGRFPELKRIWSQGAAFDVAILERYFHRLGIDPPWHYGKIRDTRTLYDYAKQRGWKKPKGEADHQAVSDCLRQIKCVVSAGEFLNGSRGAGSGKVVHAGWPGK